MQAIESDAFPLNKKTHTICSKVKRCFPLFPSTSSQCKIYTFINKKSRWLPIASLPVLRLRKKGISGRAQAHFLSHDNRGLSLCLQDTCEVP